MLSSTRVLVRLPSQTILSKASYSTAKVAPKPATPTWKPLPPKPAPAISKPPPPSKQIKKDSDILNDDIIVDTTPILTSTIPVQPINTPIQPFAKKPAAPISRVVPPRPAAPAATPFAPRPPTPTTTTPSSPSTPSFPTFPSIPEISTPPVPTPTPATLATPVPPPAPTPATAKPKAKPKKAAPKVANATNANAGNANAGNAKHAPTHAERAALSRDLAGRSPQQLLTQIAQLQQHNATLQSQLVYHSAVDAIYGETGFNQFRNLISEFTEEEALALKTSGFDGDSIIHHLEAKQRELCLQFTQTMGTELSKHVTSNVKRLKDQHRQSASAATATQQTLRNAGVPDTIISSTLTGLQPHLDELQIKIVRWEKLKADIDLLLATYSANH